MSQWAKYPKHNWRDNLQYDVESPICKIFSVEYVAMVVTDGTITVGFFFKLQ